MYRIGTLIAIVGLLIAETSWADYTVSCKNSKGPANSTTVTFAIKATESRRLGSDILLGMDGNISIVSTSRVAQYLAKENVIYLSIDDVSEDRILEFKIHPSNWWRCRRGWKGQFQGAVTEISGGRAVERTKIKCQITLN